MTIVYFALMPFSFSLCQTLSGIEIYHFQTNLVSFGLNPYPDLLSPLYVIVEFRNLFQSIERGRFSR